MDIKKTFGFESTGPLNISPLAADQLSHIAVEFEVTMSEAAMVAIHAAYIRLLDIKREETSRAIEMLFDDEPDSELPF